MSGKSIGIIDSGSGGLCVLKRLQLELPLEEIVYIADTKYIPYGGLSAAEIEDRVLKLSHYLIGVGVKAIVLACNTATAYGIDSARKVFNLPIIGVEPPVKPASLASRTNVIGIMATAATVSSRRFNRLLGAIPGEFLICPCPGLAEAIENQASNLESLLERYLEAYVKSSADVLALGCTHYELIRESIQNVVGSDVQLFEPSTGAAKRVKQLLTELNLLNSHAAPDRLQFLTTGDPATLKATLERALLRKCSVNSIQD